MDDWFDTGGKPPRPAEMPAQALAPVAEPRGAADVDRSLGEGVAAQTHSGQAHPSQTHSVQTHPGQTVHALVPVAQAFVPAASPAGFPPTPLEVSQPSPNVTVITAGGPQMMPASMGGPAMPPPAGGYMPIGELTVGSLVYIGGEYYRVEQVVGPKPAPPPPGTPPKPQPRLAPTFSARAPKEATLLFKDAWDGREAGRSPRGVLASCHEAMLVVLAHLETRAKELQRRGGKAAARREGGFFRAAAPAKSATRERIEKLIDRGLLLPGVAAAAQHVKLEPPAEPEARSQVSDADVDSYISLLWLMMEQGFDQAQWSEDGKAPPHRLPPFAPAPGQGPKPELPPGATILLPVSRNPAKPA